MFENWNQNLIYISISIKKKIRKIRNWIFQDSEWKILLQNQEISNQNQKKSKISFQFPSLVMPKFLELP